MKVGLWIQIENQAPRPAWWTPHTELRTEGRIPASTSVGQNLLARHSGSAQIWVERQMLREKRLLPGRGLSPPHPDTRALAAPTSFPAAAPHTLGYAGHVISQGHPQGEEHVVRWGKVMPFAQPWKEAALGSLRSSHFAFDVGQDLSDALAGRHVAHCVPTGTHPHVLWPEQLRYKISPKLNPTPSPSCTAQKQKLPTCNRAGAVIQPSIHPPIHPFQQHVLPPTHAQPCARRWRCRDK